MFKKIWDNIIKYRDAIYIFIVFIVSLFLISQCNKNDSLNKEVNRLNNNIYALTDTLTQYVDENGRHIAEKHAFQLTEKELRDSVELLKIKNREYLTYINTNIGIRDTIEVPTYIDRVEYVDRYFSSIDTIYNENITDKGYIRFDKSETFGKSSRSLYVSIPYYCDSLLHTGNANVDLTQNIYVESMIDRDTKTGETFVRLISDYPNLTFNSGMGVVVTNSNSYEKSMRKTRGVGLAIGPSFNVGYDWMNKRVVPTVGVSVTLGFTWTPKWLQW